MADTICGIDVRAFTVNPTPDELGAIVAHWDDAAQAEFFMCFAQSLRDCCGFKDEAQIDWIARVLVKKEMECCDGKGSDLVKKMAWFINAHDPEGARRDRDAAVFDDMIANPPVIVEEQTR